MSDVAGTAGNEYQRPMFCAACDVDSSLTWHTVVRTMPDKGNVIVFSYCNLCERKRNEPSLGARRSPYNFKNPRIDTWTIERWNALYWAVWTQGMKIRKESWVSK